MAAVLKQTALCKDEFLIFTAYVMLAQGSGTSGAQLTFPALSQYFAQPVIALPVFNGIELPRAPQPDFNPFGDGNDDSDDGFGNFDGFQTPA